MKEHPLPLANIDEIKEKIQKKEYESALNLHFDPLYFESMEGVDAFLEALNTQILPKAEKHSKESKTQLYKVLVEKLHALSEDEKEHPIQSEIYEHLVHGLQHTIKEIAQSWGLSREKRIRRSRSEHIDINVPRAFEKGQLKRTSIGKEGHSLHRFEELLDRLTLSIKWDDINNIQSFFDTLQSEYIPEIFHLSVGGGEQKKIILMQKLEDVQKEAIHQETQYELDLAHQYSLKKRNSEKIDSLQVYLFNLDSFLSTLAKVQCQLYLKSKDYEKSLGLYIAKMIWGNEESMNIFLDALKEQLIPEVARHHKEDKAKFFDELYKFYLKISNYEKHHPAIRKYTEEFGVNLHHILCNLVEEWGLPRLDRK